MFNVWRRVIAALLFFGGFMPVMMHADLPPWSVPVFIAYAFLAVTRFDGITLAANQKPETANKPGPPPGGA